MNVIKSSDLGMVFGDVFITRKLSIATDLDSRLDGKSKSLTLKVNIKEFTLQRVMDKAGQKYVIDWQNTNRGKLSRFNDGDVIEYTPGVRTAEARLLTPEEFKALPKVKRRAYLEQMAAADDEADDDTNDNDTNDNEDTI